MQRVYSAATTEEWQHSVHEFTGPYDIHMFQAVYDAHENTNNHVLRLETSKLGLIFCSR